MSRARPFKDEDGTILFWRDSKRDGQKATANQLELLATIENDCDLDELLDENLTQGEVVTRLNEALGRNPIPIAIVEKRQKWRQERQVQPQCRICQKKGDSTKHHFVNKWILKELQYYQQRWADRSKNCIPVCIDCHRELHDRSNGSQSIAEYLYDEERKFAHDAISALLHERPKIFELLVLGDESVYESRLIKDWCESRFLIANEAKPVRVAA